MTVWAVVFQPLPIDAVLLVVTGAVVSTEKVAAALVPVLPAASVCDAVALYAPVGSAELGVAENVPLEHVAVRARDAAPVTATLTVPSPVEQVPVIAGVPAASTTPPVGAVIATVGATVSTVNGIAPVLPVTLLASVWLRGDGVRAVAERWRSPSSRCSRTGWRAAATACRRR